MKIKVCGNRDKEVTEQLSKLPIDYLGFIFVPESTRVVTKELVSSLEIGEMKRVGVFRDCEREELKDLASSLSLSVVQLHGDEDVEYVASLREELSGEVEIWKAVGVSSEGDLEGMSHYEPAVDAFLFDTKGEDGSSGGTGRKFSWEILTKYKGKTPYVLAGGIALEDAEVVKKFCDSQPLCLGVDINSRFEIEPGKKDVSKVKEFLKVLES